MIYQQASTVSARVIFHQILLIIFLYTLTSNGLDSKISTLIILKMLITSKFLNFILKNCWLNSAVLRIKIILMRIRIFDPEWKKIDLDPDPDPGYFFKIYWIFFNKAKFSIFCLIFMLKLNEPFWNKEIFIIFLFFNSSDLGFESVLFFIFFAVFGWYFAPWMRIFLLKSCGARSNGSGSKALKKKVR